MKSAIATIDELNKDLFDAYRTDKQLFKELTNVQSSLGLLFGSRPTCPFLRPHFLSRQTYEEILRAAEAVAAAAETVTLRALEDPDLMDRLDLTEAEQSLAGLDPGYPAVCASGRLDTFVTGDDFRFLEYNAETPAGVGDQMQLMKVLKRVPAIRDFLSEHPHWSPEPHRKLLECLIRCYRECGGRERKPNIAIVDWEGVSTEAEFYTLKDYFESMGYRTLVADPSELEYEGEELHAASFRVDILYKRLLIHEFLEKAGDDHPMIRAYTDGAVCMVNSFRVKIPHKKSSFAILTDERYSGMFTDVQLEAISKHVPWTRKVEECSTAFHGESVDLPEFIRRNRESMLLKPNDDYGGKGIVLGWESSEGEWDDAIQDALEHPFVVQERVAVEKQLFPVYDEAVTMEELLVDFDPFLFNNKVEGGMVRLSSSSLVNVTQGGGQTALVVLEDR